MKIKKSNTIPGAASECAYVWLPGGGMIIVDTKDDAKNNDLAAMVEDWHNEWHASKLLVQFAQDDALRHADNARKSSEDAAKSRAVLSRAMSGSSGFNGPVRCEVTAAGVVWLMDPTKRGKGLALHYPSLDALWRQHPELRPVKWGEDEDGKYMILDGWAFPLLEVR